MYLSESQVKAPVQRCPYEYNIYMRKYNFNIKNGWSRVKVWAKAICFHMQDEYIMYDTIIKYTSCSSYK